MKLWQCFQYPYVFSSRLIPGICLADDTIEKFNIFFICEILFVHFSVILVPTLYITMANSLSRMEYWSNCNEACNLAN
jgi:hypothetical protein